MDRRSFVPGASMAAIRRFASELRRSDVSLVAVSRLVRESAHSRRPARHQPPHWMMTLGTIRMRSRSNRVDIASGALLALAGAMLLNSATALARDNLLEAVRTGDRAQVERLLEEKSTDVNARGERRETALHWAAFYGDLALARRLIGLGADVEARVKLGNTPLHQAAYAGHGALVALLLGHGADPNARNHLGYTPLHWAARNGHADVVALLLTRGASPDALAEDGTTPRTLVARHGDDEAARMLGSPASGNSAWAVPGKRTSPRALRSHEPAAREGTVARHAAPPRAEPGARGYRVQLASVGSETRARAVWARLQRENSRLLGDLELFVEPLDPGDGRSVFRVRTELLERARAHGLCEALSARGLACFVSRIPAP